MAKQQEKTEKESMLEDMIRFMKTGGGWWKLPILLLCAAIAYRLAFSAFFFKAGDKEFKVQAASKPTELLKK